MATMKEMRLALLKQLHTSPTGLVVLDTMTAATETKVTTVDHLSEAEQFKLFARLCDKVVIDPVTGCWLWQGAISGQGYGYACFEDRMVKASRLFCCAVHGPMVSQMDSCHAEVCPRSCVNPDHVRPDSRRINILERFEHEKAGIKPIEPRIERIRHRERISAWVRKMVKAGAVDVRDLPNRGVQNIPEEMIETINAKAAAKKVPA